ncbi:MAG: branched-chain amino acid ABC transporter permease, partial [Syntrophales bacterium]|nr:branched-chain amino acid ABC transporter permease [Syntrophales bacterium]
MRKFQFHSCGNYRETYEKELTVFETDYGRIWMLAGALALFVIVPYISSPYTMYIFITIAIVSIASVGLNILIGYTGQISLGHGAFFGVGAYAAAVFATRFDLSFLIAIPAAGFITALVGMIFGLPSSRLKGLYLTIATLAGQFI